MEKVTTSLPATPDNTVTEGGTATPREQHQQHATTGTEEENTSSTQTMVVQQMNNHNTNPGSSNNNNNSNNNTIGDGSGLGRDYKGPINNNSSIDNNNNNNNKNNDSLSSDPIRVAATAGSEQHHHDNNNNNNNNNGVVVDTNMNTAVAQAAQATDAQTRPRSLSVNSLGSFSMGGDDNEDGSDLGGDLVGAANNTNTFQQCNKQLQTSIIYK